MPIRSLLAETSFNPEQTEMIAKACNALSEAQKCLRRPRLSRRRQRCGSSGRRREVAARQDRRADAGERFRPVGVSSGLSDEKIASVAVMALAAFNHWRPQSQCP